MNVHFISLFSQEKEIDAIVNFTLQEFHVPGIAVAVVSQGKVIHCKGYGMRDLDQNLPVTENTIFSIASNTKAFTSFVIGQLVDEGKMGWDDPVIKHIPEFCLYDQELTSQVTLRDLLAHRTGIPRNDVLWYLIRDMTENDIVEVLPHLSPVFGFREKFQYNNFMYVVAGKVIHDVTNNPWEQEIAFRILKPLKMDHTSTRLNQAQESLNFSQPYAEIEGKIQKLTFLNPLSTQASGGMYSSVSDMIKWVQLQLFDKTYSHLIKEDTLNEMHRIHMPFVAQSDLEFSGYGLGWEINVYKNRKQVHHGGTYQGFFSEVSFFPEEKIGLVILTNSSTDGRFAISYIKDKIYNILLKFQDENCLKKIQEERLKTKHESQKFSLQKYEGLYTHPAYGTMQIFFEGDSLIAVLGKMKTPLIQKDEGIFEARYSSLLAYGIDPRIEFSFISNSSGEIEELQVPFEHFRSAPPIIFKK